MGSVKRRRDVLAYATPCVVVLLIGLAASRPIAAQHETATDIADGGRVFQSTCANCHGPDGNQIAGVDLGSGQFTRASSDADLIRIIRNGIPNTPMPASSFSEAQAAQVVAYLRSVAASKRSTAAAGDSLRGKAVFEGKGTCTTCHRVNGNGSRLGPDLSVIGQSRRAIELERSLLEPAADVSPTNRFYRVTTKEGVTTIGRLLNHDTYTIQLLDAKEQLRSFEKSTLKEYGFAATPMPSYRNTLTPQEVADVVSYMVSLKARAN
jgi:putative heme-binding domain-containing protein